MELERLNVTCELFYNEHIEKFVVGYGPNHYLSVGVGESILEAFNGVAEDMDVDSVYTKDERVDILKESKKVEGGSITAYVSDEKTYYIMVSDGTISITGSGRSMSKAFDGLSSWNF